MGISIGGVTVTGIGGTGRSFVSDCVYAKIILFLDGT